MNVFKFLRENYIQMQSYAQLTSNVQEGVFQTCKLSHLPPTRSPFLRKGLQDVLDQNKGVNQQKERPWVSAKEGKTECQDGYEGESKTTQKWKIAV